MRLIAHDRPPAVRLDQSRRTAVVPVRTGWTRAACHVDTGSADMRLAVGTVVWVARQDIVGCNRLCSAGMGLGRTAREGAPVGRAGSRLERAVRILLVVGRTGLGNSLSLRRRVAVVVVVLGSPVAGEWDSLVAGRSRAAVAGNPVAERASRSRLVGTDCIGCIDCTDLTFWSCW